MNALRAAIRTSPSVKLHAPLATSTTPSLTVLFAALLLLIAGYVVVDRRRHARLETACTAAWEQAYGTTSPRPSFEMGYSYGEPVFKIEFASKAAQLAAADANAAFLHAIDALCKDRGRKRQFKAQRAVFFQHPGDDEAAVAHCCDTMRAQVGRTIVYADNVKTYGLKTSIVGTPALRIAHCPWCGVSLPTG
jgi:hypothetical protein